GREALSGRRCGPPGFPGPSDGGGLRAAAGGPGPRRQLESILEPCFRTKTAVFWTRTLDDAGVPNDVPLDTHGGEVPLYDSDNVELGLVARYQHPLMGDMRQFGQLINFSETPSRVPGPPPLLR